MSAGAVVDPDLRVGTRRAAMPRAAERSRPATAAVIGVTVLAAVFRFYRLGHQGFWYDEAYSDLLVHFTPGAMLALIPHTESTPPFYYCVAWVWVRVFGFGEAGLRSLSALSGTLVIPVLYGVGLRLSTRRVALTVAALAACNPLLIWYSQEGRSYMLLVLLCAVSLYAFCRLREAPERRWLIAWAFFSGLALTTHYYAIVTVVPEAIWLLWTRRGPGRAWPVRAAVAFVALVGAALIPMALAQNSTRHDSWIAPMPLIPRLEQVPTQFMIGLQSPLRLPLELGSELVVVAAILIALIATDRLERRAARLAAGLSVAGIGLNLLLVAVHIDNLITRNTIALWLPLGLLVACGLGARRIRMIGLLGTVVLCLMGAYVTLAVAQDRNLQRPDWRYVAQALGPQPAPGQPARAVMIQRYRFILPLKLYMPGLQRIKFGERVRVSHLYVISIRAPRVGLCWWGAACNLTGTRYQRRWFFPGMHVTSRRQVLQFTIITLTPDKPSTVIYPAKVNAALRSGPLYKDELLFQPPR